MDIMPYVKARKRAQKTYRSQLLKGGVPYLPALEDFISQSDIAAEMPLGLQEIPLDAVVGTRTASRTHSFSSDFLPLLPDDTEFAVKWSNLYEAHINEGIREPVIAVEFMNHFYITEGNKRVSVLKFSGAVSIRAQVTRLVPLRDNSLENRIYYEYMDFYRLSAVNYLTFSQEGSYHRLQELLGKGAEDVWTSDEKLEFHSAFIHFQDIFEEYGGQKLSLTTGDALLVYLEIYGYDNLGRKSYQELREELKAIWQDFEIYPEKRTVELITEPSTDRGNVPLLSRFLPFASGPSVLRIGFVYDRNLGNKNWTYNHELGRLHLQNVFPDQVTTATYEVTGIHAEQDLEVLKRAIDEGCTVLFTTSPTLLHLSLQAALKYPAIRILNCSLYSNLGHLQTYYGRMYEAKYLTGILAGILSPEPVIGYMADYPIYGTIASINAFALGLQAVNPKARLLLKWSCRKNTRTQQPFDEHRVAFVSEQDLVSASVGSRHFGLYDIRSTAHQNIALPIWNWGRFYEEIIRSMLNGARTPYQASPEKSINYFWGLSSGIVDVICSNRVPERTRQLMETVRQQIVSGQFEPFSGEIHSQDGALRNASGAVMPVERIGSMDWLADNIIGSFPEPEELTEPARRLVSFQGIEQYRER